ncbi:RNA-directed DNA polymerase, eukaryota [Tanacetum coccineum]
MPATPSPRSVNNTSSWIWCRVLWDYILHLIDRWDGDCVIMGDFNEVRTEQERYGSVLNVQGANAFNTFISLASLIDLPLNGYAYTWAHKIANKMCKLDRFLVSKGLVASFLFLLDPCLDRNLSNHHPILMQKLSIDYGPTPFRFIYSWFNLDGFDKMVEDTWKSLATIDSNASSNEEILSDRSLLLKELNDINFTDSLEGAQKSKVRWAIEGDENTKFFHDILNTNLERNVSNEEKKSAIWDCGMNTSPGSDGFTFEFFRRYWKLLEHDIVAAIKEFFTSDKLPTRLNLSLKGIDISNIVCPLCHASVESGSHIFFSCLMARHLWRKLMRWWELEDIDLASYDNWLLWLNSPRLYKRLKEILEVGELVGDLVGNLVRDLVGELVEDLIGEQVGELVGELVVGELVLGLSFLFGTLASLFLFFFISSRLVWVFIKINPE